MKSKNWLRLTVVIIIILALNGKFFSQEQRAIDSLKNLASIAGTPDSIRIKLFGDISWELLGRNIDESLDYARKELVLSLKTNRKTDIAQSESDLGNIYNRKGLFDTALIHYNTALRLRQELRQDEKAAGIYSNMATVLMRQSKFKDALDINFKALKIFEKSQSPASIRKQSTTLGNIGNLYHELSQKKSAEIYYRHALTLAKLSGSKSLEAGSLVNIGGLKYEEAEVDSVAAAKNEIRKINSTALDSALYYFSEAEKIMVPLNAVYDLGVVYNDLGKIYFLKKDPDKAIFYYEKSLKNREAMDDKFGIGLSEMNLGEAYVLKKDYKKGIDYLTKCAAIFSELKNYLWLKQSYQRLSQAYEDKKDYFTSLRYHALYAQLKDSLFSKENASKMAEMHVQYETEKKEKDNLRLQKINTEKDLMLAKRNNTLLVVGSVLLLVLVSSVFFYQRNKLKQKQKFDSEMLKQQEVRNKAIIEAEEKERMRIARDLHDGVGQMLSAAKLNLSNLESVLNEKNSSKAEIIKNAINLVDDSVKEVRTVSHNMMPGALIKSGLAVAVQDLVGKISNLESLKINLEIVDFSQRLDQTKEIVLYRVMQELLNNVIRHSGASAANVQMIRHGEELTVMVEDNGKGFDTALISSEKGIGLKNIQSRINFLDGRIDFDSSPGRGTTIVIEIKCQ